MTDTNPASMRRPRRMPWLLRIALAVGATLLPLTAAPGCSSDDEGASACDPAQCATPGAACINNDCAAPCETQNDCVAGSNCVFAEFADSALNGNYCAQLPYTEGGTRTGQNEPCAADDECDQLRGYLCRGGECRIGREGEACTSTEACDAANGYACLAGECRASGCSRHEDCPGGICTTGEGPNGPITYCTADEFPLRGPGQYGTVCSGGASDCDEANGFVCLGAGEGDLNAYCTQWDCGADSDCPTGFVCEKTRVGDPPCETACGFDGDASDPECVPAADIGAGKKYECGALSLRRNVCRKRSFCHSCETDADCLGLPNQICAKDISGEKRCTTLCDPGTNSCPWGNAATCDVWDTDLGLPTCAHRFGSCTGTGEPCHPCLNDDDCGGGNKLCLSSSFTGERFCVDLTPACSCPNPSDRPCNGGGCPTTPGNLQMQCYDIVGIEDSPLYQACYGANTADLLGTPQTGCWPSL